MKLITDYKKYLAFWIFIAMTLGIIVGAFMNASIVNGADNLNSVLDFFGDLGGLFIKALKMLVVPLVFFSVVSGVIALGRSNEAGKVGGITVLYYTLTTAFAVVVGLAIGTIFKPGVGATQPKLSPEDTALLQEYTKSATETQDLWGSIQRMIPDNIFTAFVDGLSNILPLMFFAVFFGLAVGKLALDRRETITNLNESIVEALLWMLDKVMLVAPIGVFGLMAQQIGQNGVQTIKDYGYFLLVYCIAQGLHTFGVYPLLVSTLGKMSPLKFVKKTLRVQAVAVSTSSSMATLPVTMEVAEDELGVSNETSSFVIPLGATVNMDGNAIYYALVCVFIAQMYGINLGVSQFIAIIISATIGSVGQAGVPGPSLLAIAVILAAGLPTEPILLLFGLDRIFDMIRTAVNVTGDLSCAVVVENFLQKDLKEKKIDLN